MPAELLVINPTTVKIGEMEKDGAKIIVPVAKGLNGRNYFRIGNGTEILNFSPIPQLHHEGSRGYVSEFRARLEKRFLTYIEGRDDFVVGLDATLKDENRVLSYNHRELAVWVAFEATKFKITSDLNPD